MFGFLGFTVFVGLVCVAVAIYVSFCYPNDKKSMWVAIAFAVIFFVMAMYVRADDTSNRRENRGAVPQLKEMYPGIRVEAISTQYMTVSYELNGKYCEGVLLYHNGKYYIADNATCAKLDTSGG